MPQAGYCEKCAASVWLEENGTCPEGHGRESITAVRDIEQPTIERKGIAPATLVLAVAVAVLAGLAVGFAWGVQVGDTRGYASGDEDGYDRGYSEGMKWATDMSLDLAESAGERLIRTGFSLEENEWALVKFSKREPGGGITDNIAHWEIDKMYSPILETREYRIEDDALSSREIPSYDW